MATRANMDGTRVFPGVARLARETGWSERTVSTGLRRLEASGFVVKVRKGNSRAGKADEYQLVMPTESPAPDDKCYLQPATPSPEGQRDHRQVTPPSPEREGTPPEQDQIISTKTEPDQSNLAAAKEMSEEEISRIAPSFWDDDEIANGSATWPSTTPATEVPPTTPQLLPVDPEQNRAQRDHHNQMLREEQYTGDDDPSLPDLPATPVSQRHSRYSNR